MQKKTLSLVELLKGVPALQQVLDVMESKKFVSSDTEISADAIIIGMLSPLERGCFTVLDIPISKLSSLGKCPINDVESRCLTAFKFEMNECPFTKELGLIADEFDAVKSLRSFMFALITSRLKSLNLDSIHLNVDFKLSTSAKITTPETIEVFQGAEELSLEEMLAVSVKGTFLEPVIAIMESGNFIDEEDLIQDGEQYVRDMSDFEKALWMEISKIFQTGKTKSDELDKLVKTSDVFVPVGMMLSFAIKANQLGAELEQLESFAKPLKSFFWNVVKSNIHQEILDCYQTTGIRHGFKIVMFNEED